MEFIKEFWEFLKVRKKYWLLPIFLILALFGGLIILTQGSAVAPFIYNILKIFLLLFSIVISIYFVETISHLSFFKSHKALLIKQENKKNNEKSLKITNIINLIQTLLAQIIFIS